MRKKMIVAGVLAAALVTAAPAEAAKGDKKPKKKKQQAQVVLSMEQFSMMLGMIRDGGGIAQALPGPAGKPGEAGKPGAAGKDVKVGDVFAGVWPFVACDVGVLALLIAFPPIVLFLPQTMFGG